MKKITEYQYKSMSLALEDVEEDFDEEQLKNWKDLKDVNYFEIAVYDYTEDEYLADKKQIAFFRGIDEDTVKNIVCGFYKDCTFWIWNCQTSTSLTYSVKDGTSLEPLDNFLKKN